MHASFRTAGRVGWFGAPSWRAPACRGSVEGILAQRAKAQLGWDGLCLCGSALLHRGLIVKLNEIQPLPLVASVL